MLRMWMVEILWQMARMRDANNYIDFIMWYLIILYKIYRWYLDILNATLAQLIVVMDH